MQHFQCRFHPSCIKFLVCANLVHIYSCEFPHQIRILWIRMLKLAYSGTVCLVLNLYCCICLCLHSWLCNRTSQMYLFCKCVTVVSCTAIWFPGLRSYLYLSGCTQMWPWYCDLAQAQALRGLCPWYPCLLSYFWFQFLVITISSLSYSHKFMHLLALSLRPHIFGQKFPSSSSSHILVPCLLWNRLLCPMFTLLL